jgi:competence protein ComFC
MGHELNEKLNDAQRSVMDFFFPRRCPFCLAVTGKRLLCEKCERTLPSTGDDAVCTGAGFGRCAAPLYYEGTVRQAILRYKFKGELGGLSCFGAMMAQCAAESFSGEFDAITWVPVSKKRLRKRGMDQVRLLASSVCVDWHTMPISTLEKTVDNPPQSGLDDPAARRANVLGVYQAVDTAQFAGKRLLLVDDILTTGATLSECVRVLKAAGAADVVCLTLARKRGGI